MRSFRLLSTVALLAGTGLLGCGEQPKPSGKSQSIKVASKDDHDHSHSDGPHGGTILEFGKYHGEFCVDHGKKQITVYILDGEVKKAVPISVEKLMLSIKTPQFQVDMLASPQEGDPKGSASRFIATDERFGKEQEFEGTVSGVVDGKPYLGDFKEEPHADHDHGKK